MIDVAAFGHPVELFQLAESDERIQIGRAQIESRFVKDERRVKIIDLVRLRGMVQDENDKRNLLGARERRYLASGRRQIGDGFDRPERSTPESIRMKLLSAAASRGGKLSVTEGVMATGKSFAEVEAELDAMAKSGYVGIDVDEETGRVTYAFGELSK